MTVVFKDYFDNQIQEGSILIYPVRGGSRLWIEEARVIGFSEDCVKVEKRDGRKTKIKNFSKCFIFQGNGQTHEDWTR
jgi:hypothetical protein